MILLLYGPRVIDTILDIYYAVSAMIVLQSLPNINFLAANLKLNLFNIFSIYLNYNYNLIQNEYLSDELKIITCLVLDAFYNLQSHRWIYEVLYLSSTRFIHIQLRSNVDHGILLWLLLDSYLKLWSKH